jgi:hydroxymethylpyrimidine pyrophosphatase-like HAD family hydrolase
MIYASDLDQTLIYSLRSGRIAAVDDQMSPAETKDELVTSYMSNRAFLDLQAICSKVLFVPVTTRTIAQYLRIHLIQELGPQYAVTSNGGNILINGVPDLEWNKAIKQQVDRTSATAIEVKELFEQIASPEWVIGGNLCDGLFYSYRIQRELMPQQDVEVLAAKLSEWGWNTSIQGRKIYFVPTAVNKRDAVIHLKEQLGKKAIIASGDSLLDQILLDAADYAIAAKHGELFAQEGLKPASSYTFTEASGIFAADEIVRFVHDIIHSQGR